MTEESVEPVISPNAEPDQAWKALSLVNEWIRHAETKAGVVLAASGVAGGALYNLVKNQSDPPCGIKVAAVIAGLLVFAAGFCATAALIPRRRVSGKPEDFSNLLFYSHVASKYRHDEPSYSEVLTALTTNKGELTRHIANQVHANSIVAHRKFYFAAWSIGLFAGALVTLAVLALTIGTGNG
ncbi:Pycsar system effector family protein [Mycolicibacterium pulveris]|uniref:Pycsar system effector family protein n=1 Tax=Mycolicibacterium pulveris TaxID=36813 RepID=UPI003CECE36F